MDENRKSDEEIEWEEAVYRAQKADFEVRLNNSPSRFGTMRFLSCFLALILTPILCFLLVLIATWVWLYFNPIEPVNS